MELMHEFFLVHRGRRHTLWISHSLIYSSKPWRLLHAFSFLITRKMFILSSCFFRQQHIARDTIFHRTSCSGRCRVSWWMTGHLIKVSMHFACRLSETVIHTAWNYESMMTKWKDTFITDATPSANLEDGICMEGNKLGQKLTAYHKFCGILSYRSLS